MNYLQKSHDMLFNISKDCLERKIKNLEQTQKGQENDEDLEKGENESCE